MRTSLRNAWRDIAAGVDLELYFLLGLALAVFLYHIFEAPIRALLHWEPDTISAGVVNTATLLALSAIGFGLLQDRQARRKLQASVDQLSGGDQRPLTDVLVRWSEHSAEFRERLSRAKTFDLLVRTPHRTVQRYQSQIREMLQLKDSRVRILAVDPDSEAMRLMCQFDGQCEIMMRVFLEHALPSLMHSTGGGDQIQVRVMNALPSCLLALIDTDAPDDGVIYATMMTWGQPGDLRPSMRLTHKDAQLFHFFRDEFESLWANARPGPPAGAPAPLLPAEVRPNAETRA